ncbi:membrane-spanning 4-domains subfamily A member 12-like [Paramisgurnus dabryanus]|uniref:membrane-spanning 4-domains subfamily A member 12-like n=1 Tax=Paramisgurnus dabryanus TaxID=90735 RepID=UPI0031F46500
MTSQVISTDNGRILIQINPQIGQDDAEQQDERATNLNTLLMGFLKVQLKTLGTVQIMIGVVFFLFGFGFTTDEPTKYRIFYITNSGITHWGSLIYIAAGSLSVVAENKLHPWLVKASLGMNVCSAVTAGIAIIISAVDLSGSHLISEIKWPTGTILVFSILQLIISISISAFAYTTTFCTNHTVVNVSFNQNI